MANEYGISKEDAHSNVQMCVENAVNFIFSEFEGDWSKAEKYYAGGTDLEEVENRSKVVKTVVRDSIRAVRPSVMRAFLQARKIVEYQPSSLQYAAWCEQQSEYATQLFWESDGYRQLLSAFDTAAKLKIGPMQVNWVENPTAEYFERRSVDADTLSQLMADEGVALEEVEEVEDFTEEMPLYDITGYRYHERGKIEIEAFPNYEFFISRDANSIDDACQKHVHGRRRVVTVEQAIEMGLDYSNWKKLDYEDPEQNEHTDSSYHRRGYQKEQADDLDSDDLMQHKFLLTAAYKRFDIEGTGDPKLYCFWLGGTSYELLDMEPVEESPIEVMQIDPIPFTVMANAIADLTIEEQDMGTSVLRAIADNFHLSNNPRHAGDPKKVNFDDLVNPAIAAPIRLKGETALQTVVVPFTGQGGLMLMDYLDRDVEEKIGYTKASTGLDPDAMQSTDKDAVLNTIQMSQGQIELIVRNMIETCLIPLFRKMLKLIVAYGDPMQIVRSKGTLIPMPTAIIDPDLVAEPKLGLGTGGEMQRVGTLQFILGKQEALVAQYGVANPFCSLTQVYNTIEDLVELGGVKDVGRYFNTITPEIEQEFAAQQAQAAQEAAENAPPTPQEILAQIEGQKAQLKAQEQMLDAKKAALQHRENQITSQLNAIVKQEELDLKRDELAQERVIELAKIAAGNENERIKAEQKANNAQKINVGN